MLLHTAAADCILHTATACCYCLLPAAYGLLLLPTATATGIAHCYCFHSHFGVIHGDTAAPLVSASPLASEALLHFHSPGALADPGHSAPQDVERMLYAFHFLTLPSMV